MQDYKMRASQMKDRTYIVPDIAGVFDPVKIISV